jgi:hypothetical protein
LLDLLTSAFYCNGVFTLYLDESGDHAMDRISPLYPVFVLGGVIIPDADYEEVRRKLDRMKQDYLESDEVILHTADMSRNRNGFEFMKNTEERERFITALTELMDELPYTVIAVAVRKDEHKKRYGAAATDPYHLAMEFILERYYAFLGGRRGALIAECRNEALDRRLSAVYEQFASFGTRFIGGEPLRRALPDGLQLVKKSSNIAGLQLADLVVSPIGRHVMGKIDHEDWKVIERHFRKSPAGGYAGYGLKVFP